MQKLLTIVVPVYKVEQYINKCLDSCIIYKADGTLDEDKMNQLEVIIVNDGTPDRSAELSREYTVRYPQTFRQIDKENGGHGSAWNVGLKEATGKYLRFLDSDDWLTNLDKLMEKLTGTDADLVFTPMNTYYAVDESNIIWSVSSQIETVIPIQQFKMADFDNSYGVVNFMRCTYKTVRLKSFYPLFREGVRYDDAVLFIAPLVDAKSFLCLDVVLYNYYIGRAEQTMSKENQLKHIDQRVQSYVDLFNLYNSNQDRITVPTAEVEFILSSTFIADFQLITQCKFPKARKQYKVLLANEPNGLKPNKTYNRFKRLPFIVAFYLEKIRQIKNE